VATAELIRVLLLVDIVGMGLLAMFFLRRRVMGWGAYLAWGIFAVLIPVFGPFLVIAFCPGSKRRE
jgi:hypothetical protein